VNQVLLNLATAIGLALISFTLLAVPSTKMGCQTVSFCSLYLFMATVSCHRLSQTVLYAEALCVTFESDMLVW
jgi:hypothetical protein